MPFMGRKLLVLVTKCCSAFLPNRHHFCSSLAVLPGMTPQMPLGFPGTPNMMTMPKWTCPSRWQNSVSFSNLLLFQKKCSSASAASWQQTSRKEVRSRAAFATEKLSQLHSLHHNLKGDLLVSSRESPDPAHPKKREDSCFILLLVRIQSSTPFSTQQLMKLTKKKKKLSIGMFVAGWNLL